MIDLKQFRRKNNLGQSDIASFLSISVSAVSAFETGRAHLGIEHEKKLLNNDRGWIVEGVEMAEQESQPSDWPAIFADLSAKFGEQNKQIDRLLTIVEQLTAEKK